MNLPTVLKALQQYNSFLISTHVNPDADGLCSELSLALYLQARGKKVCVLNEEPVPKMYEFLPRKDLIKCLGSVHRPGTWEAAIIVDCGDIDRIGKVKNVIGDKTTIINVDHHVTNDSFGHINLVEPKSSSTAEVIHGLLEKDEFAITGDMAVLLYLGIMTDTGSFRYDNTSSRTHRIVGELLKFGFSVNHLYKTVYENISHKDFARFKTVLNDLSLSHRGRVASLILEKKTVDAFTGDFDLRDRIFAMARSIKEVEVVVIFTQVSWDETRVNFRSKKDINVARLAAFFGGGGHECASGCWLKENLKTTKRKVLQKIGRALRG